MRLLNDMSHSIKLILFFMLLSESQVVSVCATSKSRKRNPTLNNAKLNDAVEQQQALIEQQLRDIEAKDNTPKTATRKQCKTYSRFRSCK